MSGSHARIALQMCVQAYKSLQRALLCTWSPYHVRMHVRVRVIVCMSCMEFAWLHTTTNAAC